MTSHYRPVPHQVSSSSTYPPYEKAYRPDVPVLTVAPAQERSRLVGAKTLGPVFMVVLLSGGLATTLLFWLYTHALVDSPPQTFSRIWQSGYFLANEGTEVVNGLERAKANGLTISAATSHIISSTNSAISGIFAYRVAAQFLDLSSLASKGGESSRLPTPLQFALLLCLCHAGSLGTMGAVLLYIFKKGPRKATVSPLLKQAVALVGFAYLLTHGVGLADFFLHKNTGTVKYLLQNQSKKVSSYPYGRSFNTSACGTKFLNGNNIPFDGSLPVAYLDSEFGAPHYLGCYMGIRHAWGIDGNLNPHILRQSLSSVANASADTSAFLVSPGVSLAAATMDEFPQNERSTFSASSITVSIECKPVAHCFSMQMNAGMMANCTIDGNKINATTPGIFGAPAYDQYGTIPNPFQFLYWFKSDSLGDRPPSFGDSAYQDVWFSPNGPTVNPSIAAVCNISVDDVTYTWINGSYHIDTSAPTSGFIAGAFFGPMFEMLAASDLSGQIEVMSLIAPTVDEFTSSLSNLLANAMVARASGLLEPTDTLFATPFYSLLITQYPIIPLIILLVLLYTYAILAISLMVAAMLTRSSHIILERDSGGTERISTLALAQRSIVSPLSIIAAFFTKDFVEDGDAAANRARASVALEDTALFGASENTSTEPARVIVGLGGGNSTQPMFGLWLTEEHEDHGTPLRTVSYGRAST